MDKNNRWRCAFKHRNKYTRRTIMKKISIYNFQFTMNFQFLIFIAVTLVFLLLSPFPFPLSPGLAQDCGGGGVNRAEGLVTSPILSGKFSTAGKCIISESTAFAPFKIPTYEELEALYYTRSKAQKFEITSFPSSISDQSIYRSNQSLTISSNYSGAGTAVVFINGSLDINTNLTTAGSRSNALVLIVKDNVTINPSVTLINAVIISSGTIYTGTTGCNNLTQRIEDANPLVIYGALISLDPQKPIRFCRSLTNNTNPAETINSQVKYLVLLRNILSSTAEKWAEIP
jgi:hypothetical protein